ncbi:hypothetical protein SGPA1_12633 [Streptomyces misionensis JCM 4497]
MRDVAPDRAAVQSRGLGRLRLLRLPLPVLLGPTLEPGVRPDRNADHVGAGQPEDRRARGPCGDAGGRRRPGRRPRGHRADLGQGLRVQAIRKGPRRARHRAAAALAQAGEASLIAYDH